MGRVAGWEVVDNAAALAVTGMCARGAGEGAALVVSILCVKKKKIYIYVYVYMCVCVCIAGVLVGWRDGDGAGGRCLAKVDR